MRWWPSFLRRSRNEQDLEDEIRFDFEQETKLRIERGEDPASARHHTRAEFGRIANIKEDTREAWGWTFLDRLAQDVHFALRGFRKSPGFVLSSTLTLALGIGLCCFLFTYLNGMLLRPLPVARDAERLVAIEAPVSYPHFELFRDSSPVLSAAAAYIGPVPFAVAVEAGAEGRAERISGHLVSLEYFSTLGVDPAIGRFFDAATERRGAAPAVVVSDRFWRARLGADPQVTGRKIRVNGTLASIVGVAPPKFLGIYPVSPADIFVPITADPAVAPELSGEVLDSESAAKFRVVIRLAPKVSISAAEAALDAQARGFEQQESGGGKNDTKQAQLVKLALASSAVPWTREQLSVAIVFFGLLMGLILTFTCANLAGLTLARGNARMREFAVRLSLGANRKRLIRQLLTESILLAAIGGAAGLVAAYAMSSLIMSAVVGTSAFPPGIEIIPDLRMALLTFAVSSLAGAGFGLLPALATTRTDLVIGLKDTAAAKAGRYRRFGLRNLFMVYQVSAAVALVLISGYLLNGMQRSASQGPGFDPDGLYLFSLDPLRDGLSGQEAEAAMARVFERVPQITGVEHATYADRIPFGAVGSGPSSSVTVSGQDGKDAVHRVGVQWIGPRFFDTLGVAMIRGGEFTDREVRGDHGDVIPVVINQTAAEELFGAADALGQIIRRDEDKLRVIGVVRNDRPAFFRTTAPAIVSLPLTREKLRNGSGQEFTVMVRARGGFEVGSVQKELDTIDRRLTVFDPKTMRENLDRAQQGIEYVSGIYGSLGLFALVLASVGLAGVTAQAAIRRRKEIGIRLAIGARRRQILWLVMREAAVMVTGGSALGFGIGVAFTRVLAAISPQAAQNVSATMGNPFEVMVGPLLLIFVAALACYLPARQSATLDPLLALREE